MATLRLLLDALERNDLDEAAEHGDNLRNWIRKGGFRPEITGDQAQRLLDYVLDSTLILGVPR